MDAATRDDTITGLRAVRAELRALEIDVLQLDLVLKRALVRDPGAAEGVALHADDVRARLASLRDAIAAHLAVLGHLARKGVGG